MISGNLIYLRLPQLGDENLIFEWENHPENDFINKNSEQLSIHEIRNWITQSQHELITEKQLRLMICNKHDNTVVGSIDLFNYDSIQACCGIGIIINKEFRRRGFAFEAVQLLCHHAIETLMVKKIHCLIHPTNHESVRLFEKSNFKFLKKIDSGLYLYLKNKAE
jgi:diamine N-acetyltransferase